MQNAKRDKGSKITLTREETKYCNFYRESVIARIIIASAMDYRRRYPVDETLQHRRR